MRRALSLVPLFLFSLAAADRPITITIVHSNDLHAHVQPTAIRGVKYGGYARLATLIRETRKQDKNVVLLNGGDVFQGTMYFNVYEGLADLAFMNAVGYDASCVGNHEFDRGPATLATFCSLAQFPILSANLDVTTEPALTKWVFPSTVLKVGGEKVGIVGCTTPDLPTISSIGPNVKMKDLRDSVQSEVDQLTKEGVNKIIVLSHTGYAEEKQLASQLHDVDVLVGGHSHTPLGTPDIPGWRKADGPYPTHVNDSKGHDVLVVQSYEWGKVLGKLKLDFDSAGHVTKVEEAAPIVVDEKIPEDLQVKELMAAFEKPILAKQNERVGETFVAVPKEALPSGESLMANVIADAMLEGTKKQGSVVAFVNSGGVRSSLEKGPITYGNAISVQPFNNTLTLLELTGSELLAALNQGVGTGGELNPSGGSSYHIDKSQPKGSQVSNVVISGSPLDPSKTYVVTFLTFTSNGGDAHEVLKAAKGVRRDTGLLDIDTLLDYLKAHSPIEPKAENRIVKQ